MSRKEKKVWKAEARKFWPQASTEFRIMIDYFDDQSTTTKRTQVEMEVDIQGQGHMVIMRQEAKRVAMVEWLREIGKVAGEAAVWLEGLKVEE